MYYKRYYARLHDKYSKYFNNIHIICTYICYCTRIVYIHGVYLLGMVERLFIYFLSQINGIRDQIYANQNILFRHYNFSISMLIYINIT